MFKSQVLRASAGSGKTFTLTSQYLKLCLQGVKPREILAITFSRKAARDIKLKIIKRLRDISLADDPLVADMVIDFGLTRDEIKEKAAEILERIYDNNVELRVSTIHSFFASIIGQMPFESGIEPSVKIIDDMAKNELIDQAIENFLFRASDDDSLKGKIISLFESGNSNSLFVSAWLRDNFDDFYWRFPYLRGVQERYSKISLASLKRFKADVEKKFSGSSFKRLAQELIQIFRNNPKYTFYRSNFLGFIRNLENSLNSNNLEAFIKISFFSRDFSNMPNYLVKFIEKAESAGNLALAKRVSEKLEKLHTLFRDSYRDILITNTKINIKTYLDVFTGILEEYKKLKDERNVIDFVDLDNICDFVERLKSKGDLDYLYFRLDGQISHILIDEFQDTSHAQWNVLKPLVDELMSGLGSKPYERTFFCVGDTKQAIYRFRGGDSRLFEKVESTYRNIVTSALQYSYRSDGEILNWINFLFADLFDGYCSQKLPANRLERADKGYVEVQLITKNLSSAERVERLAKFVVERCRKFNNENDIPWDQMAVLVRKNSLRTAVERQMRKENLPFLTEGRIPLLDTPAAADLLDILEMFDNPDDPAKLFAVLRGPAFRLKWEDLFEMVEMEGVPLQWLDIKAPSISEKFRFILSKVGFFSVSELIQLVCSQLELPYFYDDPQPLLYMQEEALEFELNHTPATLKRFIRYLKRNKDNIVLPLNGENTGVYLMTIHKAKGLDFHTVIVADDGTSIELDFSRIGNQFLFITDESTGRVEEIIPPMSKKKRDIVKLWDNLIEKEKELYRIDELNTLYVALTRAKSNLCFIATMKKQNTENWPGLIKAHFGSEFNISEDIETLKRGRIEKVLPWTKAASVKKAEYLDHSLHLERYKRTIYPTPSDLDELEEITEKNIKKRFLSKLKGEIFHRSIEFMKGFPSKNKIDMLIRRASASLEMVIDDDTLKDCIQEVRKDLLGFVVDPEMKRLFQYPSLSEAHFAHGEKMASIASMDRIFFTPEGLVIVDFKTDQIEKEHKLEQLKKRYSSQMKWYKKIAKKAYPDKVVEGYLYFTKLPLGKRLVRI